MQNLKLRPGGVMAVLAAALLILLLTGVLAGGLRRSDLYSGSRLISVILSQDTMELRELVSDRENMDTLVKFVGAVTAAYIDFELIPLDEAGAFAAVFQSRPLSVRIDRFAYHGEDLEIFGTAPGDKEAEDFVSRLTDTGYFESVSVRYGDGAAENVSFEIQTVSRGVGGELGQ